MTRIRPQKSDISKSDVLGATLFALSFVGASLLGFSFAAEAQQAKKFRGSVI
jgi:hypothetical protein